MTVVSKRRLWVVLLLCIGLMVAIFFWMKVGDDGVAFIPPKPNPDGSHDYTLIGLRPDASGKRIRDEWVLRLPVGVEGHLSKAIETEFEGAGLRLPISIRNNQILQLRLDVESFGPFAGREPFTYVSDKVVDIDIFADRDDGTWLQMQASVIRSCLENGKILGQLVEVENNAAGDASDTCLIADSRNVVPFILKQGSAIRVNVWCVKTGNSCHFSMLMRGRRIQGSVGKQRIGEAPEFWNRLEGFFESGTISDAAAAGMQ